MNKEYSLYTQHNQYATTIYSVFTTNSRNELLSLNFYVGLELVVEPFHARRRVQPRGSFVANTIVATTATKPARPVRTAFTAAPREIAAIEGAPRAGCPISNPNFNRSLIRTMLTMAK